MLHFSSELEESTSCVGGSKIPGNAGIFGKGVAVDWMVSALDVAGVSGRSVPIRNDIVYGCIYKWHKGDI